MDIALLLSIGLNESQAKMYIALTKKGSLTPPQAATLLSLKRSTAYAVLDQLTVLGLAKKSETAKKIVYTVENPVALEAIARKKRTEILDRERQLQAAMPTLLSFFFTNNEQPGVRFFKGSEEIQEIYTDMLRTGKDLYVIRSPHDQDLLSIDFYEDFKAKKAKRGITTHLLNSEQNSATWNAHTDERYLTKRTQIPLSYYDTQVEITIYEDKLAIFSFGQEAIGMIIYSPQIARAQKQLFDLSVLGAQHISKR